MCIRDRLNTLNPPEQTTDGAVLRGGDLGLKGRVDVRMLRPRPAERTLQVLSGPDANSVFGTRFEAPFADRPEANGHRLLFSPTAARPEEVFLTVLTMADEKAPELPVQLAETEAVFVLTLADRAVVMGRHGRLLERGFTIDLPPGEGWQLLLTGLAPGTWGLSGGPTSYNLRIVEGRHTGFAVVPGGRYTVQPGPVAGGREFVAPPDLKPTASRPRIDQVFVNGQVLPNAHVRRVDGQRLVPARTVGEALGLTCDETADELRLSGDGRTAVLRAGERQVALNDCRFALSSPAVREDGVWLAPVALLAALAGRGLVQEADGNTVEFPEAPRPWPREVLWIEANREPDLTALHAMLVDVPGQTAYWAAEGHDVRLDLTLRQATRLEGVGIQWHLGQQRQARFAIETSLDGATWQRVFEGPSSGRTAGLETYAFAAHEVRWLRLLGFGNTANAWNSIIHLRVLPTQGQ